MFGKNYDFDLVVIGGGAGGLTAAKTALGFGKKVAIVEKNKLGGECTWTGCVPSKTLIKSSEVAHDMVQHARYGLKVSSPISLDTSSVMEHVHKTVEHVYTTHKPDVLEKLGIHIFFGSPTFVDQHTLQLEGKVITSRFFILATGSHPFVPPIEGMENVPYLTNQTLFSLTTLPSSMIILGGGSIGAEMAPALQKLGVKVTLIEAKDRILVHDDAELVAQLVERMQKLGVTIMTGTKAVRVSQQGDKTVVTYATPDNEQHEISADALLVATGRSPNLEGLNLEGLGVQRTPKNIVVDRNLRTTVPTIYACGDIVGPYQFSHVAWYQATTAVRNIFIPFFKKHISYDYVTWITFTDYEFATAGLTEEQAREQYGNDITLYRRTYEQIDRGMIDGVVGGMAKIICDTKGYIVGAHIFGPRAGELIHEIQVCRKNKIPFYKLFDVMHAYPAYSELLWHMAKNAYIDRLNNNFIIRMIKKIWM